MGEDCCQNKAHELAKLRKRQAKVLGVVLALNATMFVVEFSAGFQSDSSSLTGDSLDMLGDSLVYASSIYVVHRSAKAQAGTALLKGVIMVVFAVAVFAKAIYHLLANTVPQAEIMSGIGVLALLVNLLCLALLTRHRNDNLNMISVWLCSRNDIIANISVLVAAGLVFLTQSLWPDLLVGLFLTGIFLNSARHVLLQSWQEIQQG
jgi:Co/Zn/Cd efflux system component